MNKILGAFFVLLFIVSFAYASIDDFTRAEEIIKQKIACSELSSDELELIGDYYMEQMHPGELHEIMDARMGGEGSETLRQVHINIARMFYCGDANAIPMNMMSMMMGRGGYGMMGMMQGTGYPSAYYRESSYGSWIFSWILLLLFIVIIILLIVFLMRNFGNKRHGRR